MEFTKVRKVFHLCGQEEGIWCMEFIQVRKPSKNILFHNLIQRTSLFTFCPSALKDTTAAAMARLWLPSPAFFSQFTVCCHCFTFVETLLLFVLNGLLSDRPSLFLNLFHGACFCSLFRQSSLSLGCDIPRQTS